MDEVKAVAEKEAAISSTSPLLPANMWEGDYSSITRGESPDTKESEVESKTAAGSGGGGEEK